MKPGDPHPELNSDGLKLFDGKVLPKWEKILSGLDSKPSRYIIMATEAVRSANTNPSQTQVISRLFTSIADTLCIPVGCINILSEKQEAILTGYAMLCGGHRGFGIMIGGNSTEIVEVSPEGIIINHATLRLGAANLVGNPYAAKIIADGFDSLPWFRDVKGPNARRTTELTLLGGTPRAFGRKAAQAIDRIDLIDGKMPFAGYTFAADDGLFAEFVDSIKGVSKGELYRRNFGASRGEILARSTKISGEVHVPINLRDKNASLIWIKKSDFLAREEKWEEKIGSRAELLPSVALILLEAEKRLRPRTYDFSPHNMREAALRYTGLGYN